MTSRAGRGVFDGMGKRWLCPSFLRPGLFELLARSKQAAISAKLGASQPHLGRTHVFCGWIAQEFKRRKRMLIDEIVQ